MEQAPADKMVKGTTDKNVGVDTKRSYFYPDHSITIEATSQQEADAALAEKLGGASIET